MGHVPMTTDFYNGTQDLNTHFTCVVCIRMCPDNLVHVAGADPCCPDCYHDDCEDDCDQCDWTLPEGFQHGWHDPR